MSVVKKPRLIFYCGITMRKPMKEISKIIEKRFDCIIDIVTGDSQGLYDELKQEQKGDLYLPGSISYRKKNLKDGILLDSKYIGFNKAAIFVQKGNPKKIRDLNDLLDENISTILCDPKTGSIGSETKKVLKRFNGKAFARSIFEKATKIATNSEEINNALINESIDMAINWHTTRCWDENRDHIEEIEIDDKYTKKQRMVINLLSFSKHKKIAKALMKFSASVDGQAIIKKYGFYAKLSTEIKAKETFTKALLNAQQNIVIASNGNKVIDANIKLIEFFDEFDSINDFIKKHQCICDFFEANIPNDDYIYNKDYDGLDWVEYVLQNPQKHFKVIMKKNSIAYHFSILVTKKILNQLTKEVFIVITLNDITNEVKAKAELQRLNNNLEKMVQEEVEKNRKKDKLLQQQSKLAAMGEMIGAIAHQWRQPLNALAIGIQNLEDDYEEGLMDKKFLKEFIKDNMNIIKFMSKTIEDFRNFFAPSKEKKEFDIKTVIQKAVDIQKAQLKDHDITLEIKEESFIINGYESEFKQVILNIISNAKDAIIDDNIKDGKITIELNKQTKSIKIKDNANGIPKEIRDRIFEPYFTTKEEGKGTGIGLYMSKIIIEKNLGGTIELLDSDKGAEFEIKVGSG